MSSGKIKVGHYILGDTLGVGTFGKVKVATHDITGHKVGVKILNRNKISSLDMASKVRKEIQFLKMLNHPHIIKLYEVISTPTDIFMIMEYVPGGELFDHIVKNGRMDENQARHFFQQIISAVEYMHQHKIVHRDLKPENLLLDHSKKNIKIGDFGLSNSMPDGEFLKTSCGSPNYAAPEVISGSLYSGTEVDVWSCGVILYALLCGKLPFDDENIPILFKKIKSGIYTIPPWVTQDVKELITKMITVDPLKRISIAEIKENEWFKINLPPHLRSPEAIESLSKPVDSVVAMVAQRMSVERDAVLKAISDTKDSDLKVIYNLYLDHSKPNETGELRPSSPPSINTQSLLSSSLEQRGVTIRGKRDSEAMDIMSPSSITTLSTSIKGGLEIPEEQAMRERRERKRSKWHMGIRSRSKPNEVMDEVYMALKNIGMDWKATESYYSIYARYHHPDGHKTFIGLQLYKVDERNYLLDFKNPSDPEGLQTFDFFTVCSLLITELAISSS